MGKENGGSMKKIGWPLIALIIVGALVFLWVMKALAGIQLFDRKNACECIGWTARIFENRIEYRKDFR